MTINRGKSDEEIAKRYLQRVADRKKTANPEMQKIPVEQEEKEQIKPEINIDIKNPQDYVIVPNTNILIAKKETFKGLNWNDTHFKLAENGLFMPAPKLFTDYFQSVIRAEQGKEKLYDGAGNLLKSQEVNEIYKYLTTDYNKGCWTWLDALFKQESDKWKVISNHKVVNNKLVGQPNDLEKCLMEDCFCDLDFNKQGLAISKSKSQSYSQSNNIYFWHPRNNAVARFNADSGRAYLYCYGGPDDRDDSLGVFACAVGAKN